MLSQEGPNNGVVMYRDGKLWSVANLTDDPRAAVVAACCMPLYGSLKNCNEVSTVVAYCTVWNATME